MDNSGCGNNAGVSPASPVIRRLLFSFYSSFRFSGSSVREDSDLKSRSLNPRRLVIPDIDYITFRRRLTDYHPQKNGEIRISGSKVSVRPPGLNNNMKSL
jgi:hypothetical protein